MSRGLHLLGLDPETEKLKKGPEGTNLQPYFDAAGAIAKGITEGLKSNPSPPAPVPVPKDESNTVWYVVGGAAVLTVVGALLWRSRG